MKSHIHNVLNKKSRRRSRCPCSLRIFHCQEGS